MHQRGLSDHVSLVLHVNDTNWGPRPLRMLKCWEDDPGYADFVRDKWSSFHLEGWGGFVLKQKLKMIKQYLKEWHHQHSKNLERKILDVKNWISSLDIKGEETGLLEEGRKELHELSVTLHSLALVQTSIDKDAMLFIWSMLMGFKSKVYRTLEMLFLITFRIISELVVQIGRGWKTYNFANSRIVSHAT